MTLMGATLLVDLAISNQTIPTIAAPAAAPPMPAATPTMVALGPLDDAGVEDPAG